MPLTPLYDALILLGFLACKSMLLMLFIRMLTGDDGKINLLKAMAVVSLMSLVGHFIEPMLGGILPASLQSKSVALATLLVLALGVFACRFLCQTPYVQGAISLAVLIPVSLAMDSKALPKARAKLPEGPSIMHYLGLAEDTPGESAGDDGADQPDEERPPDKPRKVFKSLRSDFAKGVDFTLERTQLMAAMSPAEIQQYRDEMAVFMDKVKLADNMYALAALQEVDTELVKALVAYLAEAKNQDALEQSGLPHRTIPQALAALQVDLLHMNFSDADLKLLQRIGYLMEAEQGRAAIDEVRQTLEYTRGYDALAGGLLAALIQAETGMPAFQYFAPNQQEEAPGEAEPAEDPVAPALAPIPTSLGVVRIPKDSEVWDEWHDAANSLQIKGFLAQGNEIAIYLEDKTIFMPKDTWEVPHGVYAYTFVVDEIFKGMVYLSAKERK